MATVASSPLFINGDDITAVLREMVDDGGAQILQTMIETGFGVTVLEEEVLFQFTITYLHALRFVFYLRAIRVEPIIIIFQLVSFLHFPFSSLFETILTKVCGETRLPSP